MTLPVLPIAPNTLRPIVFAAEMDAHLAALGPWSLALDELGSQVEAAANTATDQALLAATNGQAQVTLAAGQVALATTQAGLATTNGQAQVTLAAGQVALATTQAGLATDQVALATDQAGLAATNGAAQVTLATTQVTLAAAAANFRGNWSALNGALAMPSSVAHLGAFWALNVALANVALATPGVSGSWTRIKTGADVFEYDSRATLRTLTPADGDQVIVKGLGLFVWESASTEPDDDESCFATASGKWLLQAAAWDLVDAWQSVDDQARDDDDEDEPLRFSASFASKVLTGSATCAITSVASVSSASFTGTVTGAAVGDRVIATPPEKLGDTATSTALLSCHAWVSAANTVTIMLTNASAQAATTNPLIRAAWPITVIKS